jgi:predicted transport protein
MTLKTWLVTYLRLGNWGNGDYQVLVESSGKFDYLMTLIKQSFAKHS